MQKHKNIFSQRLPAKGTKQIAPDSARLAGALRAIGYKFEHAVADLVDNSINAGAKNIVIRFITEGETLLAFAICDDGRGMDDDTISEAMRFGSKDEYEPDSLGKYGMGLKLASMSHAKVLTLVSRKAGVSEGRRWTPEGIANDWSVDFLVEEDFESTLDDTWQNLDLADSGTIVIWKEIDRLKISSKGLHPTIRNLKKRLAKHLGLTFHRFIEDDRLKIVIDDRENGEPEKENYANVDSLNPFGFSQWPSSDYPRYFNATLPELGKLTLRAHICPPNSKAKEYKLIGNAAALQGFYFYRNDRLIQTGGWNALVDAEAEPHGSLARVSIDLPPKMDGDFGLNVQKSAVITPQSFISSVRESDSPQGITFADFRNAADEIYRNTDDSAAHIAPMIPSGDIPPDLTKLAERWFKEKGGKYRRIKLVWSDLDGPEVFEIQSDKTPILLNERYRKTILGPRRRSKQDLPLLKTAIFLLLKDFLIKKRLSKKDKEQLAAVEGLIRAAAKLSKG